MNNFCTHFNLTISFILTAKFHVYNGVKEIDAMTMWRNTVTQCAVQHLEDMDTRSTKLQKQKVQNNSATKNIATYICKIIIINVV